MLQTSSLVSLHAQTHGRGRGWKILHRALLCTNFLQEVFQIVTKPHVPTLGICLRTRTTRCKRSLCITWTVAHQQWAGWKRSITKTAEASAPPRSQGTAAESTHCIRALGTKPGAWRSPLNEQMRVILKVEFKPTTCHRRGKAEKG